jgi:hypothetical protein
MSAVLPSTGLYPLLNWIKANLQSGALSLSKSEIMHVNRQTGYLAALSHRVHFIYSRMFVNSLKMG